MARLEPAHNLDVTARILVRDRFGHEHGLSDYIGPCIPEGPIRHKHAVGVSALQQASMPRERLRSIPRESATQRLGISIENLERRYRACEDACAALDRRAAGPLQRARAAGARGSAPQQWHASFGAQA